MRSGSYDEEIRQREVMHAHTTMKFGNMIRSLFLLLLLVGFTQQEMPPNASIRMRFVLDKTNFRETFLRKDQRLTRVSNMLNNVTSSGLGIHIQRLPRERITHKPAQGEEFSAYFERLGKEGAVNTSKYWEDPAEFVVILTLQGTQLDEELARWSHPDKDVCQIGSYFLMSVTRADNVLKSDEDLRDELLKLLLLGQFGIDNRTGSICHCLPPCSLFLECTKTVIQGKLPKFRECLNMIRTANTTADDVAICGNGLVEKGESCDCVVSDTKCRTCCDMSRCCIAQNLAHACQKPGTCKVPEKTEHADGLSTTTGPTGKAQANMVLVISLIVVGLLFFVLLVICVVALLRRRRAKAVTRTTRPTLNSDSWSSSTSGIGSSVLKSEKTIPKPERKTPPLKPV